MKTSLVGTISSYEIKLVEHKDGESQALKLNSSLSNVSKGALVDFLQRNLDIFALKLEDIPCINPKLISHWLNIDPSKKSV